MVATQKMKHNKKNTRVHPLISNVLSGLKDKNDAIVITFIQHISKLQCIVPLMYCKNQWSVRSLHAPLATSDEILLPTDA
jgi:hypothetical protein